MTTWRLSEVLVTCLILWNTVDSRPTEEESYTEETTVKNPFPWYTSYSSGPAKVKGKSGENEEDDDSDENETDEANDGSEKKKPAVEPAGGTLDQENGVPPNKENYDQGPQSNGPSPGSVPEGSGLVQGPESGGSESEGSGNSEPQGENPNQNYGAYEGNPGPYSEREMQRNSDGSEPEMYRNGENNYQRVPYQNFQQPPGNEVRGSHGYHQGPPRYHQYQWTPTSGDMRQNFGYDNNNGVPSFQGVANYGQRTAWAMPQMINNPVQNVNSNPNNNNPNNNYYSPYSHRQANQ